MVFRHISVKARLRDRAEHWVSGLTRLEVSSDALAPRGWVLSIDFHASLSEGVNSRKLSLHSSFPLTVIEVL